MKKLLFLILIILTFTGCIFEGNKNDLGSDGIYPPGTPFPIYSYAEKESMTEKALAVVREEGKIPKAKFPKLRKEYNDLMSLLIQMSADGNKEATKELEEWAKAEKPYLGWSTKNQ